MAAEHHPVGCACPWCRNLRISNQPILARLLERSIAKDDCWIWTGETRAGYGVISIGRRRVAVHRLAFAMANGREPTELVLHRCDNPPCWNPSHLFEGDDATNARDRAAKGRGNNQYRDTDACKHGHPFDEANTYTLTRPDGRRTRSCRTCNADAQRRRKARVHA